MSNVNLRGDLARPLTNAELDVNFSNLNADKMEKAQNLADLADAVQARTNLGVYSKAEADANAMAIAIALG